MVENRTGRTLHGTKLRVTGEGVEPSPWSLAGPEQGTVRHQPDADSFVTHQVPFVLTAQTAAAFKEGAIHQAELQVEYQYHHRETVMTGYKKFGLAG